MATDWNRPEDFPLSLYMVACDMAFDLKFHDPNDPEKREIVRVYDGDDLYFEGSYRDALAKLSALQDSCQFDCEYCAACNRR